MTKRLPADTAPGPDSPANTGSVLVPAGGEPSRGPHRVSVQTSHSDFCREIGPSTPGSGPSRR